MADALAVIVVLAACMLGYALIGDLMHRLPGRKADPEELHLRERPLSRTDLPAHDPRADIGGFTDENYGTGTRSITTPHPLND